MPLNLSFTHMVVVGLVALVVLGPERLPGVARSVGNLYREWKRLSTGLEAEVREAFADFTEPFRDDDADDDAADDDAAHTRALAGPIDVPELGPGTGLMSAGPPAPTAIPELAPPPQPATFVPYTPGFDPASR